MAFYHCRNLTSVVLPEALKTIKDETFMFCTNLSSITIPPAVTDIDGFAFGECKSLSTINIPQSVINIRNCAFYGCTGLTSIRFNSATTSIYDDANTIPATTKIIGYDPSTAKDYAEKYGRRLFETIVSTEVNYPIIVIPGVMGSKLYSDANCTEIQWSPLDDISSIYRLGYHIAIDAPIYVKQCAKQNGAGVEIEYGATNEYETLVKRLCNDFPNRDVYFFSYDWRKSNIESAVKLQNSIDAIIARLGVPIKDNPFGEKPI